MKFLLGNNKKKKVHKGFSYMIFMKKTILAFSILRAILLGFRFLWFTSSQTKTIKIVLEKCWDVKIFDTDNFYIYFSYFIELHLTYLHIQGVPSEVTHREINMGSFGTFSYFLEL